MKANAIKILKMLGVVFAASYIVMLAYGIYEIGLIKMQLWLFLGAQIIIATLTIKTQMIYKDMEKMNILIQKNKTTIKCSLLKSS